MKSFVFKALGPLLGFFCASALMCNSLNAGEKKDQNCVVNCHVDDSRIKTTSKGVDDLLEVGEKLVRPTKNDVLLLCEYTSSNLPSFKKPPKFEYEEMLIEMAGTTYNDPLRIEKVRSFWNANNQKFICPKVKPTQPDNSFVLKSAVSETFDEMIVDLATVYKVDLNVVDVDQSGKRSTVLDYIVEQKKNYSDSPEMLDTLDNWYDLLEENGAKLAKDIK